MAVQLKGLVEVIPCMVDRICSEVTGEIDENDLTVGKHTIGGESAASAPLVQSVRVKTEHFPGEIIVMKKPNHLSTEYQVNDFNELVPFGGLEAKVPELPIQATYYAERKFLLVNGGHTVLAFLTMIRAIGKSDTLHFIPPGEREAASSHTRSVAGDFLLLNWETMNDDERIMLWSFSVARLLLLVWQYETSILMDAHGVDNEKDLAQQLLHYAKETLKRFSAVPDTTKRILAGGVDNR